MTGDFAAGDPVELADESGRVVARGLVGFDSEDLPELLGKSTPDLPAGACAARPCIATT